jgi:transposase
MQLKTILNRVESFKSFVYGKVQWVEGTERLTIEVEVHARKNGRPICADCGRPGPGYDRLPERRFEFVPLWGIAVCFVYAMRRVDCPTCGVTVERVPWAEGKCHLTTSYRWFLAGGAKYLSWQEVADRFRTNWRNVFESVKHAVSWGLEHRNLRGFFKMLSDEVRGSIRFVCSDMWQPYLNVIAEQVRQAVHVLDRFHIMKKINEAIDEVRRGETRRLEGKFSITP